MTIYEHRTSQTTASGSVSSTTLDVQGGILRQVYVNALTDSTAVFRFNLSDANGKTRLNYDYHIGQLNDVDLQFPISGKYTCNITNASPNDTFDVILAIQE